MTLFGDDDPVKKAIARLKAFEPPDGYTLAFSGGKDSQTIYHLAKMAEVKFTPIYNNTTVDPPELIYFIREHYPDVFFSPPEYTMWQLIVKKRFPPTRRIRYCCDYLKERKQSDSRIVVTGVRWDESVKRKQNRSLLEVDSSSKRRIRLHNDNDLNRQMLENCLMGNGKHILNPIVDWSNADVWDFIKRHNLPYCILYDEGFKRIGCIGCPIAGKNSMSNVHNDTEHPTNRSSENCSYFFMPEPVDTIDLLTRPPKDCQKMVQ